MILGPQVRAMDAIRLGVPLSALAFVMVLLPIPDARGGTVGLPLTYSELGPLLAGLDLAAGIGIIAAGLVAWLVGPRPRVGLLAMLAGVAWFGPDLFGLVRTEPVVRSIGRFLLHPFLIPLLTHLAIAATTHGRVPFPVRVGLVILYAATGVVAMLSAATYSAYWDASCIDCAWKNPLLVISGLRVPLALLVSRACLEVVAGLWLLFLCARAARPQVRSLAATRVAVLAGVAIGSAASIHGALLILVPKQDPGLPAYTTLFVVLATGVVTLSASIAWVAAQTRQRTLRVREVATSLEVAAQAGAVGKALARALDDDGLRVAYWLSEAEGFVDAFGRPTDALAAPGRSVTPIQRAGKLLATVVHADRIEGTDLATEFGPQMLVALDNERLRAARMATLRELRESRTRIVGVGDAERRRLERDLHDGAQQGLLTVLFDLRLEHLAAQAAHLTERAERIGQAESLAQEIVDELRRQAHGIHPAVLSRSGLLPALISLSEEASIPVEITADVPDRAPEPVESAAYQAVVEALQGAVHRGATELAVTIRKAPQRLVVETRDDAPAKAAQPPMNLVDRVGAVGGRITAEVLPGGGTLQRVELPCG